MVTKITGLDAFFAQEVQDLNGLDTSILSALHDCVGFITVLHPRGDIERPDGSTITRASVWIEQEIAIAAYIQRIEKRQLPIIVFKHRSVCLEGLRQLLHLNPVEFTDDSEVLAALPERIAKWPTLTPAGIRLQLESVRQPSESGHPISKYTVTLINDTNQRIREYTGEVSVPSGILKHWSTGYTTEIRRNDPNRRAFGFSEAGRGDLNPHNQVIVFSDDYCVQCGAEGAGGIGMLISKTTITAKVWIDNQEYAVEKTIEQLALER